MGNNYEFNNDDLHEQIISMDNTIAKKATKFTVEEQRLFYITLASIKPNQKGNEIEIDKKAMFDMLGFKSHHYYSRIRSMFKKLAMASWVEFGDDEIFDDGFLISAIRTSKKKVYVTISERYIPLLIELAPGFTRLLSDDAISFKSKFSMLLYQQFMRLNNQGDYGIGFTTKELKTLFGMTKDDYVNSKTHRFDRYNFEKYTIEVAVADINEKSKCIRNLRYEKRKKGNRIQGYVFYFDYIDPNEVRNVKPQKKMEPINFSDLFNDDEFDDLLDDLKKGKL